MSEKENILLGFTGSFRPEFYKGIARQSFERSIGYLLLLILAVSIIFSVKYTITAKGLIGEAVTWINTEFAQRLPEFLPEIHIRDGEVSSPVEQPFIHHYKEFVFILDTTGTIVSLEEYQNGVLITKRSIIVRTLVKGNIKTEEHSLSPVKSLNIGPGMKDGELITFSFLEQKFSVTRNIINKLSQVVSWALFPLLIVSLFFYHLFVKFIHLLLFSLGSVIANRITEAGLEYSHLLNMGVFALTPPAALTVLVGVLDIELPLFWLLYIVVYCTFLMMAINQCKVSNMEGELNRSDH